MPLLELRNVSSFYGNVQALKGVSLQVEQGEVVTLLPSPKTIERFTGSRSLNASSSCSVAHS